MIGIYKITNPKGKIYIGQSINIEKRWLNYKCLYNVKSQIRLYRSFQKYGVNTHIFEIIEECSENDLNNKERYYQDLYNVIGKKGLNCRLTESDNKSGKLSQETKDKVSKTHIKLRNLGLGNPPPVLYGSDNGMFNKKHSKESIRKMKDNKIIKKGQDHYNSSIFLDFETGVFYFSVREVANALNKSYNYVADRIYGKVKINNLNIIKV
mgnify:CR=1 FL=1|jgi:group I intron endonuclease